MIQRKYKKLQIIWSLSDPMDMINHMLLAQHTRSAFIARNRNNTS